MPTPYTTLEAVLDELPQNITQAIKDKIPDWIEDESRAVDADLTNYATPFAAKPGTPPVIERITRLLTVDRTLRKMGVIRSSEEAYAGEFYRKDAERMLRKLRDGEMVVPGVV